MWSILAENSKRGFALSSQAPFAATSGETPDSLRGLLNEAWHVEGCELIAASFVELALELHPVQTQSVQETLQNIHTQQHAQCDAEPSSEHEIDHDAIRWEGHCQAHRQSLLEEDQGQLLVRQRQCPDTQIRSCVGDSSQDILNRLDDLMDEDLSEFEFLAV